ncbi:MAG: ATP-binding protein [Thiobacillaceae bacterium]|jgi:signal transduction histidine kinase|nr:ATP-binding protein [Thiobacillaceae bacterium]
MRIRTRAFMLGLLPALVVAAVLTAFHVYSRLNDLEKTVAQQGMSMARHLSSASEYGVFSGNTAVLEKLLEQTLAEPGVKSAMVVWPDQTRLERGDPPGRLPPLQKAGRWQDDQYAWFTYPVELMPLGESDPFIESDPGATAPLAWVAVSIDLEQKRALVQQLLLASLSITFLGLMLAILLINTLALSGVQPLLDIVATVKRISSGAFGARMEVTANSPELRELQSMVNQLSESLRSYQQDMEARVHIVTSELEHKKREAEQASLAKSRFLAAASHDLRQPMHAISLYVESLKAQLQQGMARDTLDKIERSINGTVELFNAILDVTKLDAGVVQPVFKPVPIRQLFLHLADEFAATADRKNLSLRVRCPDVWIESDAVLLERIVRNLLSNALEHTREGGILLSARPYKGQLRLQVWDSGSGISAEDQPRVFQEFYQVEKHQGHGHLGMGLGLSIVRRLARLLGYPLQLRSIPGRGTVFSLDVPLLARGPAIVDSECVDCGGQLTGRVVVVDDDPAVRDALGALLSQWGMETWQFGNLHEVRSGVTFAPDLVLADYQLLDGETGLAVVEAIQARWGTAIPAILITGDTRPETVRMLDALGHPVLYKPIRSTQLLALLRKILARSDGGQDSRDGLVQQA